MRSAKLPASVGGYRFSCTLNVVSLAFLAIRQPAMQIWGWTLHREAVIGAQRIIQSMGDVMGNSKSVRFKGHLLIGVFAALTPVLVMAQESQLEEVTVTARKVAESELNVPVDVNAFTAADIQNLGLKSMQDVADFTPNFYINNDSSSQAGRAFQSLIIRGLVPGVGNETGSTFINGAPMATNFLDSVDDVERVEILEGPQSAYFGRETFAGAVNVVTKTPSADPQGHLDALVGSNDWQDIRASVEGPLLGDTLTGRISGRIYDMQGQYRNAGGPDEYLGDESTRSLSIALAYKPSDRLSVKLNGIIWSDDDGPPATGKFSALDYNCNAGAAPTGVKNYICGTVPNHPALPLGANTPIDPLFQSTLLNNSLGIMNNIDGPPSIDHGGLERRSWHTDLIVDYKVPDLNWTLSSISALNYSAQSFIASLAVQNTYDIPNPNYTPTCNCEMYNNWLQYQRQLNKDASQEIRLTSDPARALRGMIGVSYYTTLMDLNTDGLDPYGPANFFPESPTKTQTAGVFFSVSYDLLPALHLTAEGRYQQDRVGAYTVANGQDDLQVNGKFTNFVPRVTLQYDLSDSPDKSMVYAAYSQGVNPGTFNNVLLTLAPIQRASLASQGFGNVGIAVNPEKLDNYEIGLKGRWLDGRVQLSSSIFYDVWNDQIQQITAIIPGVNSAGQPNGSTLTTTISDNAGKSTVQGFEIQGAAIPVTNLTVNFATGLANSKLINYVCLSCSAYTGTTNVDGHEFANYPKWTGTLGAEYRHVLAPRYEGFFRGDFIYRSGLWESLANTAKTNPTERFNFRLGFDHDGGYRVELFVLNAFNNEALVSVQNNVDVLSPGFAQRDLTVGMPLLRQFGVRASYKF